MAINVLKKRLPAEYQEVEYIESNGTQYIDTGVKSKDCTSFSCDMQFTNYSSGYMAIMGRFDNTVYKFLMLAPNNMIQIANRGSGTNSNYKEISFTVGNIRHLFEYKNDLDLYVDGNLLGSLDKQIVSNLKSNILILNLDWSDVPLAQARLYKSQMFNGDTLVRNFIPCYRKSDNEIGLYDLVNGVFYTNAGTGTFSKGSDFNSYTSQKMKLNLLSDGVRLPAEYEEVEYLQSSGTQYIDTGINAKSGLTVEGDIQLLGQKNITVGIFGGRESTSSQQVICLMRSSREVAIRYGTSNSAYGTITIDDKKHNIKLVDNVSYIDNVYNSTSSSSQSFIGDYTIFIFGINTLGNLDTEQIIDQRVYLFKIYDSDVLVRNFIPCYRISDSVAGLYDLTSKNLFDYNAQTWTTGLLYGSGVINTRNTNYKTTDFIDILEAGKTYTIGFNQVYSSQSGTSNRIAFYDENKTFISWENDWNVLYTNIQRYTRTITVPSGTKYIRYSVRSTDENVQIEAGATATEYKPFPFYTNAGTGTFTVGNDIPKYKIQPVKMNLLKETDNLFDEIAAYTKTGFTISNGEISTNYNYARHSFSQYGSNEFSLSESTTYYVSYKIKIACSNPSGNKSIWISFKNVGTGQNYAVTGFSVDNFDEWKSISFNRTLPAGSYQVALGAYGGSIDETYTTTLKDIMFDTKQITTYEPYGYKIIKI